VENTLKVMKGPFTLRDVERACPGVSREMIRKILKTMRQQGRIVSSGRGPGARWENKEPTQNNRYKFNVTQEE
jgi:hypothetical protein